MELPNFKRVMRGYDPEAVDQAWSELQRNLAEANATNKELRLQINSLREQNAEWGNRLKNYEKMEKDLRDAFLSAQRLANQIKEEAEENANRILESAKAQADALIYEAEHMLQQKQAELDNLLYEKRTELSGLEQRIAELNSEKEELERRLEQAFTQLEGLRELLR